jgi:hypothetical protein
MWLWGCSLSKMSPAWAIILRKQATTMMPHKKSPELHLKCRTDKGEKLEGEAQ